MRPTSRGSNGTYGSRRSGSGASTVSCYLPEERLLTSEPDVLALFAANPFAGAPPKQVRAVVYQYWFTDVKTKREQGTWWRRELLGNYSPVLERESDGKIVVLAFDTVDQLPE